MDFSAHFHQAPLLGGAQPYPSFLAMQPLATAVSQEFEATAAPDIFDAFPRSFEFASGYHQPQQPLQQHAFVDPPTPPPSTVATTATAAAAAAALFGQQRQQLHRPVSSAPGSSGAHVLGLTAGPGLEEMIPVQKGSDEEDMLTPAQSRRKAQNRAAQRAFRERKDKHVKDLEAKVANLEADQQKVNVENERLRRNLQEISTENELLRATTTTTTTTSTSTSTSTLSATQLGSLSPEPLPQCGSSSSPSSEDFYSTVLETCQNKSPSRRVVMSDHGEPLLAAGAAWDLIISHPLYRTGLVDVGHVSERLECLARCDGLGPVFGERSILAAIEQSVASGSDDLL
ncbi:hypothetical protein XA68_17245 [Ophiocordyceps unilateralis]|uniref:BZIP domain-containing protein n=1 Tax=Ophiocordyceps unilateralis TaxID=268505 RepID=A0A2A9P545_OPHUN|nr:hypothetical protein XA68_17245 [Ophiocordyceps unilateralis]